MNLLYENKLFESTSTTTCSECQTRVSNIADFMEGEETERAGKVLMKVRHKEKLHKILIAENEENYTTNPVNNPLPPPPSPSTH